MFLFLLFFLVFWSVAGYSRIAENYIKDHSYDSDQFSQYFIDNYIDSLIGGPIAWSILLIGLLIIVLNKISNFLNGKNK